MCTCAPEYVCMWVCMHVHTCVSVRVVCVYVCTRACVCMSMHVHKCISCTRVCVCTHTCVQGVRCRTVETRLQGGFCPQGSGMPWRALCWTQATSACARGSLWLQGGHGVERAGVDRGSPWWLCPVGGGVAWTQVEWMMGREGLRSPLPGTSPRPALPCRRPGWPSARAHFTPHTLGSVLCRARESLEGSGHIWTRQPSGTQAGL